MKLTEFKEAKLSELREAEKVIKRVLKELKLVPIAEAATQRGTSRQALIQLGAAGKLTKVKVLENVIGAKAPTFFYSKQVADFEGRRRTV